MRYFKRLIDNLDLVGLITIVSLALGPLRSVSIPLAVAVVGLALVVFVVVRLELWPRSGVGFVERRWLHEYHETEVGNLAEQLPLEAKTSMTTLEEKLRGQSGYVEPCYKPSLGSKDEQSTIVSFITTRLHQDGGVLLLGDPGAGKSLVASMVFARLADRFAEAPRRSPCPIFVRLNALLPVEATHGPELTSAEASARWLVAQLYSARRLPAPSRFARLLQQGRFVLVLDGFDEAPMTRAPQQLQGTLPRELLSLLRHSILLTCRSAFHSIYVDASAVTKTFSAQIELLPLTFEEQGVTFIRTFTHAAGKPNSAGHIVDIIRANKALKESVSRPLVLRMAVEVLLDWLDATPDDRSLYGIGHSSATADIYEAYVQKWLWREQEKFEQSCLSWRQKRTLSEWIAWEIFNSSLSADLGWGHFELHDLLIEQRELRDTIERWLEEFGPIACDLESICRDVSHRSFLIVSDDGQRHRFVHKSFFEFFVARYVVSTLDERRAARRVGHSELLSKLLPDEVIDFVRELLRGKKEHAEERSRIEATFVAILVALGTQTDSASLMACQQAANLLPLIASPETLERLRSGDLSPVHPFLKRAVAVADALYYGRHELLDSFVDEMQHDEVATSFHMGYNRIYYGDQPFGDGSWTDDGAAETGRFFRATVRHLTQTSYRYIRVMDLFTLRVMLNNEDRCRYLLVRERECLAEVRRLCDEPDPRLGECYDRQRRLLAQELDVVLNQHAG
jgi:NACHT domain